LLRKFTVQAGERKRYALALVAGLLLAAAFPKLGIAGFAWLGPGLLLMAGVRSSGAASFRIGYVGGFAFYLGALHWLLFIPLSFTPIVGWLSLAAYLAIYPGIWLWLCWKCYPAQAELQTSQTRTAAKFTELLDWFLQTPWLARLAWMIFCAALWVGLEMIVGRLFTGFPWSFLGNSQYRILQVAQIASVTGVYGVSFLVVWFSVALASALVMLIRRPHLRWHWQRELVVPFMVAAAVVAFGWQKVSRPVAPAPTLKVALIQPSIPQTWIWDPKESSNRFRQLLELSEQALTNHPDLLVWPEAAVPYMFRLDEDIFGPVTNLVQRHKIWLVLGSDDGEVRRRPNGRIETNYFNSSFLVQPDGEVMGSYRKRRLVIFGEYIPFGRRFSFIEDFTGLGSFTRGDRPGWFSMPDLHVRASILICFEDVFPQLTRTSVDDETDFILNLTNNGWFGESAAQWQHAAAAVFRAIENGLPLVRCANNGLTCWVDPEGAMHDVYFPGTTDIYGVGFKLVEVPLSGGQKRNPTFYHQHGDWFGWGCLGLSTVVVLWQLRRQRRR
jgi:apolipoprotein N-acyltransferase